MVKQLLVGLFVLFAWLATSAFGPVAQASECDISVINTNSLFFDQITFRNDCDQARDIEFQRDSRDPKVADESFVRTVAAHGTYTVTAYPGECIDYQVDARYVEDVAAYGNGFWRKGWSVSKVNSPYCGNTTPTLTPTAIWTETHTTTAVSTPPPPQDKLLVCITDNTLGLADGWYDFYGKTVEVKTEEELGSRVVFLLGTLQFAVDKIHEVQGGLFSVHIVPNRNSATGEIYEYDCDLVVDETDLSDAVFVPTFIPDCGNVNPGALPCNTPIEWEYCTITPGLIEFQLKIGTAGRPAFDWVSLNGEYLSFVSEDNESGFDGTILTYRMMAEMGDVLTIKFYGYTETHTINSDWMCEQPDFVLNAYTNAQVEQLYGVAGAGLEDEIDPGYCVFNIKPETSNQIFATATFYKKDGSIDDRYDTELLTYIHSDVRPDTIWCAKWFTVVQGNVDVRIQVFIPSVEGPALDQIIPISPNGTVNQPGWWTFSNENGLEGLRLLNQADRWNAATMRFAYEALEIDPRIMTFTEFITACRDTWGQVKPGNLYVWPTSVVFASDALSIG